MSRPVAYLRKSKVTNDRHVSWQVQEQAVRELAAKHGDTELEVLSDWNKSGGRDKRSRRGDYKRLWDLITDGAVSVVYSYSLSRLARSTIDYAELAEHCVKHGVKIRLCKEGEYDYTRPSEKFNVTVLAALAEMERDLARERATDTLKIRRERGDHIGSAGYGRKLVNGKLVTDATADVPAVIDAFREVGSFSGAARLLNAKGLPSPRMGRSWSANTVAKVIRRDAPQELAGRRVTPRVRVKGNFRLARILRCSCGQVMTGRTTTAKRSYGKGEYSYVNYVCFRGRYEPNHPRPYIVSERGLLPWVRERVERLQPPLVEDVEGDTDRLAELEAKRTRVLDNYVDGHIDRTARDMKVAEIEEAMEAVEVRGRVEALPPIEWDWPPAVLNDVLTAMIDHIVLDEAMQPVTVTWRKSIEEWVAA